MYNSDSMCSRMIFGVILRQSGITRSNTIIKKLTHEIATPTSMYDLEESASSCVINVGGCVTGVVSSSLGLRTPPLDVCVITDKTIRRNVRCVIVLS